MTDPTSVPGDHSPSPGGVVVASWIRNLVLLVVVMMWASYIIVALFRNQNIDTVLWGVPGAVYFALNPTWKRPKDGAESRESS